MLLLLSHFSCVQLCAAPETAAHQASPSLGFSRQEYWSGLPFPSPMHESEKSKWSRPVVSWTLRDPMDCIPPGSSIHGIFQARVLEWGAIAFSKLDRQKSKREKTVNSTNSLPWEQITDLKVVNFNDFISRKKWLLPAPYIWSCVSTCC